MPATGYVHTYTDNCNTPYLKDFFFLFFFIHIVGFYVEGKAGQCSPLPPAKVLPLPRKPWGPLPQALKPFGCEGKYPSLSCVFFYVSESAVALFI